MGSNPGPSLDSDSAEPEAAPTKFMKPLCHHRIKLSTSASFGCHDITAIINSLIHDSGVREGLVVAVGQHTTTALVINEAEERLIADIEHFFAQLVPSDRPYRHNDLQLRQVPPDEPRNAHSHLIALMLGNQISLPIVAGCLGLGRYQAVLLVELDGPREREVLLQISEAPLLPSPPLCDTADLG